MSYRMQHGGHSQALNDAYSYRRLARLERQTRQAIDHHKRTGQLPGNVSPEVLSLVATQLFLDSTRKPRRKRRAASQRTQFGHRTASVPVPLPSDNTRVWTSKDGSFTRDDLKFYLSRFRWDYLITLRGPIPKNPASWLHEFHTAIDTTELFPCAGRFTNEPPSSFVLSHTGSDGAENLSILIALPPGALPLCLDTYDVVRVIVTRIASEVFNGQSKPHVQMVNERKVEALQAVLRRTPFECVTRYIRKHNKRCLESPVPSSPHWQ